MFKTLVFSCFVFFSTASFAQSVQVCYNTNRQLACISDSIAIFRFSNGYFTSFESRNGKVRYDDDTKTLLLKSRVAGIWGNSDTTYQLVLKQNEILLNNTPIALFYDSTLQYFVTAYSQDSGRSMHQSRVIWAAPSKNFNFSCKFTNGVLDEISFNNDRWQGVVKFGVYKNRNISYNGIEFNHGIELDYGIDFGLKERVSGVYGGNKNDTKMYSAIFFKKDPIYSLDFFHKGDKKTPIIYTQKFSYDKRGRLKGDTAILHCLCDRKP